MEIDIKKLENIKTELDSLDKEDVLFINENGSAKYAILPIETYDAFADEVEEENNAPFFNPSIKILTPGRAELSYDEYEMIKKQILDAFDKTFKPKPEKLN